MRVTQIEMDADEVPAWVTVAASQDEARFVEALLAAERDALGLTSLRGRFAFVAISGDGVLRLTTGQAVLLARLTGGMSWEKADRLPGGGKANSAVYDCLVGGFANRFWDDGVDDPALEAQVQAALDAA